ncbi:MAG: bifunctional 4-hydroxy-2-oxoglutarate aldolase/2-dehydro-3-deoxy-phosphogluconate aldolase [Rhodopirellula sp. JB053]|uniref:bifunctional 4-hydroxy-2-oxoglutarate aldolase/2-dehydro-3-deoxy-phosphogluconate aldolase n=1 Tax=Rhodopirellula sp. JB044 TaxID=3342844 RepID=UPI00370BB4C5
MIDQIESLRIVPVVAIDRLEDASGLADALTEGGLPVAEITLRTDAGVAAIASLADRKGFLVGAGTVHSVDQAKQVADAGARFIVSPGFNPRTVQWCLDNKMPIFPGVSSPTDLETALEFGLEVVKFFPAEQIGGVKMLKALQGPYGSMRFIPTGGISTSNLRDYLSLPSVVACGGSWMVKADLIRDQKFDEIARLTRDAVELAES